MSATINWADVNWKKWQDSLAALAPTNINGLTVYWTNAIKPIVPIQDVYGRLLDCLRRPEVRAGRWQLLECRPGWDNNLTWKTVLVFTWEQEAAGAGDGSEADRYRGNTTAKLSGP